MQYMLLIYTEEPQGEVDPAEDAEVMDAYNAFTESIRQSGAMITGEALYPTPSATSVRVRDGKTVTTDGPFAETKEALGGFYVIEAADLDEAIAIAAACPGARYGTVELRPTVVFDSPA